MSNSGIRIGRGSSHDDGTQYVLITVAGVQVPIDPDKADSLARALSVAAEDVRTIRTSNSSDRN